MSDFERLDADWVEESELEGTTFTRRLVQPERSSVLEAITRLRNDGAVARDGDSSKSEADWRGRWCLSIPLQDYRNFRYHPVWRDLLSTDSETCQRTWRRFLVHSDSAPFRVRANAS